MHDTEKSLLQIEICVPDAPELKVGLPGGNFIGTTLLARVLFLALKSAGVNAGEQPAAAGQLNRSFYVFECDSRALALAIQTVTAVIKSVGLLECVRVYRFDFDEGCLRCLYPDGGASVSISYAAPLLDEALAANRQYEITVKKAVEALRMKL